MELITDLMKLREFLHGAHLATENEACSGVLHHACHKIDDIIARIKHGCNDNEKGEF